MLITNSKPNQRHLINSMALLGFIFSLSSPSPGQRSHPQQEAKKKAHTNSYIVVFTSSQSTSIFIYVWKSISFIPNSNQSPLLVFFCAFHWHQHNWPTIWMPTQTRIHCKRQTRNKRSHNTSIAGEMVPSAQASLLIKFKQLQANHNNR